MNTERRHSPRMIVNGLAYVNLEPDNGAIILNVSEGGLCFQSSAPVHKVDSIRLWFSYRSQRTEAAAGHAWTDEPWGRGVSQFIEAAGELAWTDGTRKRGGLRFKNLQQAAREQIRDWMSEPASAHVNVNPASRAPLVGRFDRVLSRAGLARLEEFLRPIQTARPWTGFSGGLLSGLLISASLVSLVSLFMHGHKLGDSIVQLGELLGGRSWSQPVSPGLPAKAQQAPGISPAPRPMPIEQTVSVEPQAPAASVQATPLPSALLLTTAKSDGVTLKVAGQGVPSVTQAAVRPSLPKTVIKPPAEPDASMLWVAAPEIKLASQPGIHPEPSAVEGNGAAPEKFLEVGKFKERLLAEKQIGRLSQFGFPVKVMQSSGFFGKTYQVLVGPYRSDSDAEAVHKDLSSRGFTARSYERGKRDFNLRPGLKVGATPLPEGDCVISWESYVPNAIVKMEDSRGTRVTLDGKWVKRSGRYLESAVVYERARDGSLRLLEIRFSGLTETLVLGQKN